MSTGDRVDRVDCPECDGTGESVSRQGYVSCWWCEGSGWVPATDPAVKPAREQSTMPDPLRAF